MTPRDLIVRVHDDGEGGYWAEVLDLPGCFASGTDLNELHEAIEEAIAMYLFDQGSGITSAGETDAAPGRLELGEMRVRFRGPQPDEDLAGVRAIRAEAGPPSNP